jgi:hypothetical protein
MAAAGFQPASRSGRAASQSRLKAGCRQYCLPHPAQHNNVCGEAALWE